jgi:Ca-activated chloride channel family protein
MMRLSFQPDGKYADKSRRLIPRWLAIFGLAATLCAARSHAQEDPLNTVHVPTPTTATPSTAEPKGAEAPAATGPDALKIHPGSRIRLNVDMVLVPVTVTDPMNRLVTGLEQEDFQVFENTVGQKIVSFASEDAPVSIGIVFDLSGSMTSKLVRARDSAVHQDRQPTG